MKTLVILGTARDESNTLKAIETRFKEYELIDLRKYNIEYYNSAENQTDDFKKIADKMQDADQIVFATPVYWYAMSGILKVFLDRFTDLMYRLKPIGKSLKGKKTFLIATGSDPTLPECFEVPFKLTSQYFEMNYEGSYYSKCE
jgi:multimeric flavodoxin WrbA